MMLEELMLHVETIWEIAGADGDMLREVSRCHWFLERFLFLLVHYGANPFDLQCCQQPSFEYIAPPYQ
jgi:hypothetical protein